MYDRVLNITLDNMIVSFTADEKNNMSYKWKEEK